MSSQHPQATLVQAYRPIEALLPARWQSGFISATDGARIHYLRTGGAKPPLILLHGIQVDGRMWLRTAQALEADYDVIMPDSRGHGHSDGVANVTSSAFLVEDVLALLRELAIDTPILIGHSMGADIAGRVAAAIHARAVLLVDPALQNFMGGMALNPDEPPPWMAGVFAALRALKTQSHAERMLTGLTLLPPNAPTLREEDYVTFVEGQARFDLAFFRWATQMGYLFEEPATIAQINCPVLLLTARPMMPHVTIDAGVAAFTANWQTGKHIHFADSGHFIPAEQFEKFSDVVRQFLAEIG